MNWDPFDQSIPKYSTAQDIYDALKETQEGEQRDY